MAKTRLRKILLLISIFSLGIIFLLSIHRLSTKNDLANGFGKLYNWQKWTNAIDIADSKRMPLMVIIYSDDCPACEVFKERFSKSPITLALSKHFVMVNLISNEAFDQKFTTDGKYFPKIIFLDDKGEMNKEIYNMGGNADYKYFYFNIKPVEDSMRKAIKILKSNRSLEL